ncbi:hypothetical protein G6L37_01260 [Agrobacterium rubi]|nr:hypothetical protein [Agrobacterium rubi]NTF24020.1 hypothetical protein [Agrobacterium rubi]
MSDKRELHRYRSLRGAQIIDCASGGYSECSVLDINSRGARLRLRRMPQSLGEVELLLMPENVKVAATTRWLRGNQCGVRFNRTLRFLEKHDRPTALDPTQNNPVA